jgi:hypothetical protein
MIEEGESLFVAGDGSVGAKGQAHETETQLGNQRAVLPERNEMSRLGRHF